MSRREHCRNSDNEANLTDIIVIQRYSAPANLVHDATRAPAAIRLLLIVLKAIRKQLSYYA